MSTGRISWVTFSGAAGRANSEAVLAWASSSVLALVLPDSRQQTVRETSGPLSRTICLSHINALGRARLEQSNLFQTYDVCRPEPAVATLPWSTGHQAKLVLDRQQKSAFEGVLGFVLCKHRRKPNSRFSQCPASNLPTNITYILEGPVCGPDKHTCGSDKHASTTESRAHMWFRQAPNPTNRRMFDSVAIWTRRIGNGAP
jgi:hypothetical protein